MNDEVRSAAKGKAILITGSRYWTDTKPFEKLARELSAGDIIIHGACPTGADAIADEFYGTYFTVERYPANWSSLGKSAGPIRNSNMVARLLELKHADYDCCVYAFPLPGGRVTYDCMAKARRAGFVVYVEAAGES